MVKKVSISSTVSDAAGDTALHETYQKPVYDSQRHSFQGRTRFYTFLLFQTDTRHGNVYAQAYKISGTQPRAEYHRIRRKRYGHLHYFRQPGNAAGIQEPFDQHRKLMYQMKDNPKAKGPRRQLKVLLDELGVEFPKEYSSFKPRRRDPLDTMDISCQIVHTRQVGIPATQETSAVRGTGRPSQQQWFNEEELKKLLKR